jgi:uncharacterized protein YcbX
MARSNVFIKSLSLYPIKALDPVVVSSARILPSGALEHDREFALLDAQGNFINGKRNAKIHGVRARYDLANFQVALSAGDSAPQTFSLADDTRSLEQWFENVLGIRVFLHRNGETGFPDDLDSPGPTIIGSATLSEVSSWFGIREVQETSRRFRANIEIETPVPFWEDVLFDLPDTTRSFRVGDVKVEGVNPCQRCVVPSRDPSSGAVIADFQRVFAARREQMLPAWAERSRFNHFYRLAVNTRIPAIEAGKSFHAGDVVFIETLRNAAPPFPR